MEIKLRFKITFVDGMQKLQEITIPADPRLAVDNQQKALMQTMFSQYATIGYVTHPPDEPDTYRLILPSQIAMVECALPSLIIAQESEVPRVTLE
jgi:hypothetical protein